MKNKNWVQWIKLFSGILVIVMFILLMPFIYPESIQQQNRDERIDAGALFYSESPQALQKSYQMQKLTR